MTVATLENISLLAEDRWRSLAHDDRFRTVVPALVRHLHAFAREVGLTREEWERGIQFLTDAGKISNEERSEFILLSDVLGLSMLVALQNDTTADAVTATTLLGPFYIEGSPELPNGSDLGKGIAGQQLRVGGTVRDQRGDPIAGATVDTWQSDAEGIYEQQIPNSGVRLRGLFRTDVDGRYEFSTIVPADYPIPTDGPVGELIGATDISVLRPAHVHFLISASGKKPLVTHLFRSDSPRLQDDVVFGVRDELVVNFAEHQPSSSTDDRPAPSAYRSFNYDFVLEDS